MVIIDDQEGRWRVASGWMGATWGNWTTFSIQQSISIWYASNLTQLLGRRITRKYLRLELRENFGFFVWGLLETLAALPGSCLSPPSPLTGWLPDCPMSWHVLMSVGWCPSQSKSPSPSPVEIFLSFSQVAQLVLFILASRFGCWVWIGARMWGGFGVPNSALAFYTNKNSSFFYLHKPRHTYMTESKQMSTYMCSLYI